MARLSSALMTLVLAMFACVAAPAAAQNYVVIETIVEEWVVEEWVEVGASRATPFHAAPAMPEAVASYGAFRVLDDRTAALVGVTGTASPANFAAMLEDYPHLSTLRLVECPGTDDDVANLELGRMIRGAGIATHVPAGGSVRSGAVELFLSGASRSVDDGAEFAVHSWMDDLGREADDYAANAPIHAEYVGFYQEMGFSAEDARAFYDMTNSVPHDSARWLTAQDMRGWIGQGDEAAGADAAVQVPNVAAPRIAYLDLGAPTF
ncbi:hypothetical protein MTsPCn7_17920 [Altererythrobacter sp. MTPC7]